MDAAIAVAKTWPLLDAARRRGRDPADGRGLLPVRVSRPHARDDQPTDGLLARTLREESGPLVARLVAPVRRLRPRRGGRAVARSSRHSPRGGGTARRTTRPPGCRWRRSATPSTACAARTRQRGLAARADAAGRRPSDGHRRPAGPALRLLPPGLAPEARLALTLRAVVGLTTPQIARAFLVNESDARAAHRPRQAQDRDGRDRLPVPRPRRAPERLGDVLAVVYVMFNEGFVSSTGATQDRDLAADAVWLAGVVATSLPGRGRGVGAGRTADASSTPGPPLGSTRTATWCCCATRTASRWDHAAIADGERHARARRRAAPSRALPAAGGHRRLPRDRAVVGGDRLAPDRARCTTCCCGTTRHRWSVSTGRSPSRSSAPTGRRTPWRASSTATRRRPAGVVPPLPRHPGRAAHHARPRRRGGRGQPRAPSASPRNDAERRLLTTRLHRHPLTDGS